MCIRDSPQAAWTWDASWADQPVGYSDALTNATNSTVPGVGTIAGGVITDVEWANTLTGAAGTDEAGVYTFENLRNHDTCLLYTSRCV